MAGRPPRRIVQAVPSVPPIVKVRIPNYGFLSSGSGAGAGGGGAGGSGGGGVPAASISGPASAAAAAVVAASDGEDTTTVLPRIGRHAGKSTSPAATAPRPPLVPATGGPTPVPPTTAAGPRVVTSAVVGGVASMSDRIGGNYARAGATVSPKIYASHEADPAVNVSYAGSASARRVLYYGTLYNSLPPGVVVEAHAAAAAKLRANAAAAASEGKAEGKDHDGGGSGADSPAATSPHASAADGGRPELDIPHAGGARRSAVGGGGGGGGVTITTQAALAAAEAAAAGAAAAAVRARVQAGTWDDVDVDLVPPAVDDPEFVHVDVSQLPLDAFDNTDFEVLSGAEWLSQGPQIKVTITKVATADAWAPGVSRPPRASPTASPGATSVSDASGGSSASAMTRVQMAAAIAARGPVSRPPATLRAATRRDISGEVMEVVTGPIAYSPVFDGKVWVWVPVVVTAYDEAHDMFGIRFLSKRGVTGAHEELASTVQAHILAAGAPPNEEAGGDGRG